MAKRLTKNAVPPPRSSISVLDEFLKSSCMVEKGVNIGEKKNRMYKVTIPSCKQRAMEKMVQDLKKDCMQNAINIMCMKKTKSYVIKTKK